MRRLARTSTRKKEKRKKNQRKREREREKLTTGFIDVIYGGSRTPGNRAAKEWEMNYKVPFSTVRGLSRSCTFAHSHLLRSCRAARARVSYRATRVYLYTDRSAYPIDRETYRERKREREIDKGPSTTDTGTTCNVSIVL